MRKRYNDKGELIGTHRMIFDEIPDNYKVESILLDGFYGLSYLGIMKYLRDLKKYEEFEDDHYYSSEVISHLALDYLQSAIILRNSIVRDRGKEIASHYLIPAAFLCRHAIELELKYCLLAKEKIILPSHKIIDIWNKIDETRIPSYNELTGFLKEIEKIDVNEIALRYGIENNLSPIKETQKFNIDSMITNSMYLFNVVDEYIVCKYLFNNE